MSKVYAAKIHYSVAKATVQSTIQDSINSSPCKRKYLYTIRAFCPKVHLFVLQSVSPPSPLYAAAPSAQSHSSRRLIFQNLSWAVSLDSVTAYV